jgi:hypothetical protein
MLLRKKLINVFFKCLEYFRTNRSEMNMKNLNLNLMFAEFSQNVKTAEVGKVTLKSNSDEALSDESP